MFSNANSILARITFSLYKIADQFLHTFDFTGSQQIQIFTMICSFAKPQYITHF